MKDKHDFKERYDCNDLIDIVRILRAPGGCPWDREQTHESIKKNFIEETYEVIEAINKKEPAMLREELGDVLLQIALHCEMEREQNVFTFDDVCDEICKKLILRHPHVFGDVTAETTEQVLTNWDAIKMQTKQQKTTTESMASVPRELPALMRAQKLQKKAAKVGFDWDDASGALDKIREEADELEEAMAGKDPDAIADELGDVLFSVVNVARFADVDAEEALTAATDKFLRRFSQVEQMAKDRGMDMKTAGIEALDKLWDEAKKGSRE
jgi:tetrapyrrole methylase family protein/MazG family protein